MREMKQKGAATGISLEDFTSIFAAYMDSMTSETEAMVRGAAKDTAGQTLEDKQRYFTLVQQRKAADISARNMQAAAAAAAARGVAVALDEETFQACVMLYSNAAALKPIMQAHQEKLMGLQHILMG